MKKLVIYLLIFTMAFSLTACAASKQPVTNTTCAPSEPPITDLEAFEEQVLADYIEYRKADKDARFDAFQYYGTDNGYHIVLLRLWGPHQSDVSKAVIAGTVFYHMGGSLNLKAYKNGEFTDLWLAYDYGWISEEAIAKAAELHNEIYNIDE